MMANSKRLNARKACVVALVASGASLAGADPLRKLKAACRGEEVCLNQVCDPTSFQYNVGSEGSEFPYTVSHSIGAGHVEFKVCPSSSATAACKGGSGGCSGLTSFKLRMRNDGLSMGRDLISDPPGRMWASCSAHGPGHEWVDAELGSLATSPDQADCEIFTVSTAGTKKPSLGDICEQKVKIVENSGWTVVDTAAKPGSCLVTLVTANGRVGYSVIGGEKLSPPPPKKEEAAPPEKDSKSDDVDDTKDDVVKPASVQTSSTEDEENSAKKVDVATVSAASITAPRPYGSSTVVSSYGQRAGVASYGQRAGVASYGSGTKRRALRNIGSLGGRRMM